MGGIVYIVDDDAACRDSLAALLSTLGLQTQTFASAEQFLSTADIHAPGCVILDLQLGGMHGMDLLSQLRAAGSDLPIIVLTGFASVPTAVTAMARGAMTLLQKPCVPGELTSTVNAALDENARRRAATARKQEIRARWNSLTDEEQQVAQRLLRGMPNKEIALDMKLGLRTVELRRQRLMQKMQTGSLVELARLMAEIEPPGIAGDTAS
jgi:two-component system response regulator FixJ